MFSITIFVVLVATLHLCEGFILLPFRGFVGGNFPSSPIQSKKVSRSDDGLKNLNTVSDLRFIQEIVKYLEEKGTKPEFIKKILKKYIIDEPKTVGDLLFKLMTSDREINDSFEDKFAEFVARVPQWNFKENNETHRIFWNNKQYKGYSNLKILRKQKHHLCYIIAPAVLSHYIITINSKGKVSDTMDVAKYENHINSGADLEKFILDTLNRKGDYSYDALKEMLKLDDFDLPRYANFLATGGKLIMDIVSEYPLLISGFTVYNAFIDEPDIYTYDTKVPGEKLKGRHAMVLVGARKDSTGNYKFLLQNWRESKYFIEVSGNYLNSVAATAVVVNKKISEYPTEFQHLTNDYLSCETFDLPECIPQEDL